MIESFLLDIEFIKTMLILRRVDRTTDYEINQHTFIKENILI